MGKMLWINVLGDASDQNAASCVDIFVLIPVFRPAEGLKTILIIKRLKIYQMDGLIQNPIDLNSGTIIYQYN